jgi:hypothetical protein
MSGSSGPAWELNDNNLLIGKGGFDDESSPGI